MEFEPHRRPNQSRLESFRAEISKMRALNWPYWRIADWLRDEHRVAISKEAIRKFCASRSIIKGDNSEMQPQPQRPKARRERSKASKPSAKPVFHYDDTQPIELRRTDLIRD